MIYAIIWNGKKRADKVRTMLIWSLKGGRTHRMNHYQDDGKRYEAERATGEERAVETNEQDHIFTCRKIKQREQS